MTLIADAKSRLAFGTAIRPGQVFEVERLSPDEFRVVRLAKPARKAPPVAKHRYADPRKLRGIDLDEPAFDTKPRLVKRGGVKVLTGVKVTREDIVAAIQADRDERENLL